MYREAMVTYIDIIGFKNLVLSKPFDDVFKTLRIFHRQSTDDKEIDSTVDANDSQVIQFSDSTIFIRWLDSRINEGFRTGLMFNEILDLLHIQGELINHGICIRGGISIGDAYYDGKNLFGPAFIRAYNLESEYAIFPRIVIDPELIIKLLEDDRLRSDHNSQTNEYESIRALLEKGSDGLYYINYLEAFMSEIDDQANVPIFITNHKNIILDKLKGEKRIDKISNKYLWMAIYHNNKVHRLDNNVLKQFGCNYNDLLISFNSVPLLSEIESHEPPSNTE